MKKLTKDEFDRLVAEMAKDAEDPHGTYARAITDMRELHENLMEHDAVLAEKVNAIRVATVAVNEYVQARAKAGT